MPTIARGSKAAGGTAFVTGTVASATEVNTDFDTVYNLVNGNLDGDNIIDITNSMISASAAIDQTKIDDISATDGAHDDTTTPGDSSSHTKPTTLSGEIQQLRYVIERNILGLAADRVDGSGTGTTGWYDLPVRGPNLIKNPSFAGYTNASSVPDGWADLGTGTPTFARTALTGATLSEGNGDEQRIVAGGAAVAGLTQTLSGLKASTQYLVVARARSTTNAAHLKTTGADANSSFRNIDDSTSSTSYVTLKGVIKTDSTPTDIVVQITTNGANADEARFAYVGVYECSADHTHIGQSPTHQDTVTAAFDVPTASFDAITDLATTNARVPSDGYEVHVEATIHVENTTATARICGFQFNENGSAVAAAYSEQTVPANGCITRTILYKLIAPTPGTVYGAYSVSLRASGGSAGDLKSPGSNLVTGGGTKTNSIRARIVRVSG